MEMINKVQEMVTLSKAELENTIRNIETQYEEFATQIRTDIQNSEMSMEAEIKKFVDEHKSLREKVNACKIQKEQEVIKLKEDTDTDLLEAKKKFNIKIADVEKNMQNALEKLTNFYTDAQKTVNKIIDENKQNPQQMTEKLAEQVEPLQKKFTSIREDVAKTLKTNFEKSQGILKELEVSVNMIEVKTKKNYTEIINRFKACVDKK